MFWVFDLWWSEYNFFLNLSKNSKIDINLGKHFCYSHLLILYFLKYCPIFDNSTLFTIIDCVDWRKNPTNFVSLRWILHNQCYHNLKTKKYDTQNNIAVFKNKYLFNFRNIESVKFAMLLKNSSMILIQKWIKSTIEKMKFWRLGLNWKIWQHQNKKNFMELMKSKGEGISVLRVPLDTKQNVFSHVNT